MRLQGKSFHGLAIGFTLFAVAYIGAPICGGYVNPALGTALPVITCLLDDSACHLNDVWVYWAGPMLGALFASAHFKLTTPRSML